MASFQKSHPLNTPGPLFTDLSCIDCGTCYHLGPEIFLENSDDKSVVKKQPGSREEWQEAKRAILSCPTNSIGVKEGPDFFKDLPLDLPLLISDNVYYCGYTSRDSYGASSYLIQTSDGNILIDSPKFHPFLVNELEQRGGVKYMLLTHQDDVADHQKFHDHFKCQRFIQEDEVTSGTKNCEVIIPRNQEGELFRDMEVIQTPGHTQGHVTFLYQRKFLFTGDHLFVDNASHSLRASRSVSWHSWDQQVLSLKKLLDYSFDWVLPGHGGWGYFGESEAKKKIGSYLEGIK